MPIKRFKTKYPGVFYLIDTNNNKIFYVRYYKGKKQIEEKVGFASHGMTAAKANHFKTERTRGKQLSNQDKRDSEKTINDKYTFTKLWQEYLQVQETKSIDICKSRFVKYIEPVFGNNEPSDISQLEIARFKKNLKETNLKPGSVNKVLELLRRITNFGKNNNLIKDLNYKIKLDKIDDEKTEFLTDEQFVNLWKAIEVDQNKDAANFIKMVLFTGMRRGELFKLQKVHIEWQTKFIKIIGPKGVFTTKIPLNELAEEILKEQHDKHADSSYFFPGKDNKKRVEIKRGVNRIKKNADLPKGFRPLHGLRHHYATMLANSGKVDLYTLQKLLGHKDPRTTQRYAHLVDKALKRGSDTNAELIKNLIPELKVNKKTHG
jgi:integrase